MILKGVDEEIVKIKVWHLSNPTMIQTLQVKSVNMIKILHVVQWDSEIHYASKIIILNQLIVHLHVSLL